MVSIVDFVTKRWIHILYFTQDPQRPQPERPIVAGTGELCEKAYLCPLFPIALDVTNGLLFAWFYISDPAIWNPSTWGESPPGHMWCRSALHEYLPSIWNVHSHLLFESEA